LGREEEELRLEQQKLADASAEDEAKQRQAEESLQSALKEIHDAQHAVEGERHQAVSVLTKLANHRTNLVNLERRRTELSAQLQKNFEGYGRGVKAIMLREEEERRRDGVYGLVADVLRVEPRYERAIEAVLGERLQLVLVESHAAGLKAVDYLRKAAQGRASF